MSRTGRNGRTRAPRHGAWRSRRTQALVGAGLLAVSVIGIIATRPAERTIAPDVAAIVSLDAPVLFTYVATAANGTPAIVAAGQLAGGSSCRAAGRAAVGVVDVNPMSAAEDVERSLDRVEATSGVARIYDDGTEHVETPEGNDIGTLPLPWLEPQGAATHICAQLRATLTAIASLTAHDPGMSGLDAALAEEDVRTGTTRWVGAWDAAFVAAQRSGGDQGVATRIEVLTGMDDSVRVVIRSLAANGSTPTTLVAGVLLRPASGSMP